MIALIIQIIKFKIKRLFAKPGSFEEMAAYEFECKAEKELRRRRRENKYK